MAKIKQDLGQLFENNSNCYADTTDDSVVMAMDKEQFVKIVTDLLTERVSADSSHDAPAALPLHIVMRSIFNELQHDSRFVSRSVCFNDDYRKGYAEAVRNFKVIVKEETGIEL